ncbi:hypothetical protein [Actinoplanes derwentensis]|uniref:Uncharacterized protein n=1 Tax=Actinoplanes derwentensis TaxID=113562 RepID=A0A1H1RQA1_9ACTN|nr:hypothetical protein [Actinoplanes derwentensis]GID84491.1 hypothetical protein Ade03nite_34150 [Actinoplanes derwentensis]SDS37890.1 hypothetical protein SAMN04489716_0656 [Actinoplanes derwentensis]
MSDFPESLEVAINNLINTLVYKLIVLETDTDAREEFMRSTGVPYVSDVTVQDYARQKADEIWGPYKDLPAPSSLDGIIETLTGAHNQLTTTGVTEIYDAEDFSLGALVPGFMADFRINQAGWRGATIDAVRSGYLDRWGRMVFLQANTIALLLLVLRAYQEQLTRAQSDVVALVNVAEEVLSSYTADSVCGSAVSKNLSFNIAIGVLSVLSAATGIAGLALTSIVAAFGAAGLSVAKDSYEPIEPKEGAQIGGDSVTQIWESIIRRTEDLRMEFCTSEQQLHDIIAGFHRDVIGANIGVGLSREGNARALPAMELFRSKPLGSGTGNLRRPSVTWSGPDPAHSPEW